MPLFSPCRASSLRANAAFGGSEADPLLPSHPTKPRSSGAGPQLHSLILLLTLAFAAALVVLSFPFTDDPSTSARVSAQAVVPQNAPLTQSRRNLTPLFGILSQPDGTGRNYLDAGYVKWIESGGGRIVNISVATTEEEVQAIRSLLMPHFSIRCKFHSKT